MVPQGFSLEHNAVSSEVWHALEKWMKDEDECECEWEETEFNQHRPVAQFGFRYDYHEDVVDTSSETPPIPDIIQRLLLDPVRDDATLSDVTFTQCIINDYQDADTIIPWHKDDMAFGDVVLVYTFLDERPLHLRWTNCPTNCDVTADSGDMESDVTGGGGVGGHDEDVTFYTAHPRHCSRYILRGQARHLWEHSVPGGKGRRISFTFRNLRCADNEQPDNSC